MSLVQALVDRLAPPAARFEQAVEPLVAKRFEQRIAELPPAERTAERLDKLFDEVARTSIR